MRSTRSPLTLRSVRGGGPAFPVYGHFFDGFFIFGAFVWGNCPPRPNDKRGALCTDTRLSQFFDVTRHAPRLLIAPLEFRHCASRAFLSRVPIWADFWADRAVLCGNPDPPRFQARACTSRPYKITRAG